MSHKEKSSTSSLHQKLQQDQPEIDENLLLEHPSYIEMQNNLTKAEEKASEYWDKLLRLQAENDNTLRRVERDIANAHKFGLEKIILELLPVIDSLERSQEVSTNGDKIADSILQGVAMTIDMFHTALKKFGVEQVDPIDEAFNPELHQAVSTEVNSDLKPNTVVRVLQKGYLLNNRLVRPALVIVSKAN